MTVRYVKLGTFRCSIALKALCDASIEFYLFQYVIVYLLRSSPSFALSGELSCPQLPFMSFTFLTTLFSIPLAVLFHLISIYTNTREVWKGAPPPGRPRWYSYSPIPRMENNSLWYPCLCLHTPSVDSSKSWSFSQFWAVGIPNRAFRGWGHFSYLCGVIEWNESF